jgi:hypothetical protein
MLKEGYIFTCEEKRQNVRTINYVKHGYHIPHRIISLKITGNQLDT